MRSIRSFSRALTTDQRGFVLISALVLSILYFALMALILIDCSRALAEANRFRARIVAATLAENAAEMTALQITSRTSNRIQDKDWQGTFSGTMTRSGLTGETAGDQFIIDAEGSAEGVITQRAGVRLQGRVLGNVVTIDYAMHSQ